MIKALFCIFSVVLGIYAVFFGVQSLDDIQWRMESKVVQYTEPPFIAKKEPLQSTFGEGLNFEDQFSNIYCYTYDDFLNYVEIYKKDREINIEVKETNAIREGIVQSAVAYGEGIKIHYEPSLLIVLNGYGSEELILEMERENDDRFLRLLLPNGQYTQSIARIFRQMDLPYALNTNGLNEQERLKALQSAYFPRYTLEISKASTSFESNLSSNELQLRMKGIIYDALIESYESGWQMVVFNATIKNLKALQTVLDEMAPLPVKLIPYPLWRDDE
ncbi:MAG: hypothetical protein U9N62_12565 [Thermotogota bacterium]|nr:hypothetical protein [Thermotogota bacterium]